MSLIQKKIVGGYIQLLQNSYTPIPERFRDFISVPKVNGYQSLHTTVITNKGKKVEFQIRTKNGYNSRGRVSCSLEV